MVENSNIEWTDHTFNGWLGCTKISPGCDNCYAESLVTGRFKKDVWGAGKPRELTSDKNWETPVLWNKKAAKAGKRARVFCSSLSDVFDNEVPAEWRERLWDLIRATPALDWLMLTKRIGNVAKMLPADWGVGYENVWLGASIVNQEEANRDIFKLSMISARVRFLSMEPLLGPVQLNKLETIYSGFANALLHGRVHWVIVGGESGPKARPMNPEWARSLRDQCADFDVPFLFKQWGEYMPVAAMLEGELGPNANCIVLPTPGAPALPIETEEDLRRALHEKRVTIMARVGKKRAGRTLDGETYTQFPRGGV